MASTYMLTLSRQTRLYLPLLANEADRPAAENRWHAIGPIRPWATYVVIETTVTGHPDPEGGYLVDIRTMDQLLVAACRDAQATNPWPSEHQDSPWTQTRHYAEFVWERLRHEYARLSASQTPLSLSEMSWRFTPHLTMTLRKNADASGPHAVPNFPLPLTKDFINSLESSCENPFMLTSLTLQYEFAAAHRLHCESWSAARNQEVFGKCNHPSGHGHNYLLEVTVRSPAAFPDRATTMDDSGENLPALINPIVQQHVLQRLDHRFLNIDVAEFRHMNPTVENIAQVVFRWLHGALPATIPLESVRVFETDKTWAEARLG
ncbi:MAG: 6-carboxytetrahydropterin synthase [Planctomycetaceae bacterium]|nr:6-carboxytetrahydropterin synthase [Planctomycetaceae bacterium]